MMKTNSQQLAPHMQLREAGTSDSFVFFGATGDLAYKQIFPALQQMILRDNFNLAISGVAKSGWTIDQLRGRVRDSLTQHGGIDEKAYAKLVQLLQYIDGDYQDPKTFEKSQNRQDGRTMAPLLKGESRLRRLRATQNISLFFRSGRTRRYCLERRNGSYKAGRHSRTGIRENRRAADDYRPSWWPVSYVQL
jgi:Glucose-6-phosphate dehydrogenase, NAD binding domain